MCITAVETRRCHSGWSLTLWACKASTWPLYPGAVPKAAPLGPATGTPLAPSATCIGVGISTRWRAAALESGAAPSPVSKHSAHTTDRCSQRPQPPLHTIHCLSSTTRGSSERAAAVAARLRAFFCGPSSSADADSPAFVAY